MRVRMAGLPANTSLSKAPNDFSRVGFSVSRDAHQGLNGP